jgi:hypothetical protein
MTIEADKLNSIRSAFPAEGLFAAKDWLLSPEPFAIDSKLAKDLERLGHQLFVFQRACNQLYQQSVKGKQPAWVAGYLDAGKPAELVEFAREKRFREELPAVIRPDLVSRRRLHDRGDRLGAWRHRINSMAESGLRRAQRRCDRRQRRA